MSLKGRAREREIDRWKNKPRVLKGRNRRRTGREDWGGGGTRGEEGGEGGGREGMREERGDGGHGEERGEERRGKRVSMINLTDSLTVLQSYSLITSDREHRGSWVLVLCVLAECECDRTEHVG